MPEEYLSINHAVLVKDLCLAAAQMQAHAASCAAAARP